MPGKYIANLCAGKKKKAGGGFSLFGVPKPKPKAKAAEKKKG
jgi:hypothetical protein